LGLPRAPTREEAAGAVDRTRVPHPRLRHLDTDPRVVGNDPAVRLPDLQRGSRRPLPLLLAGDRVDAIESHLASFLTLHPDNPFTETGIKSEFTHNGLKARTSTTRVDNSHTWIDPILVAGPWIAAGLLLGKLGRAAAKRSRRARS
jgi:hypothetical protein